MPAAKRKPALTQEELIAALREQTRSWLSRPNVTAVGVGYREVGGRRTSELTIQVSVEKKLARPRDLAARGWSALPRAVRALDGRRVRVDIVERRFRLSHELVAEVPPVWADETKMAPPLRRRRRLARLLPGVSVSHASTASGTLGALVYDRLTGQPCLLGNAHVLAGPTGKVGDPVLQPGSSDSADFARNVCGRLWRSHVGLAGDGAIALLEGRLFDEKILQLGVAARRLAKVAVGDRVVKSGRTTGVTWGVVRRAGLVFRYNYGGSIGPQDIGAFEIEADPQFPPPNGRLCDGGDSGSLWLIAENGQPTDIAVGLHFADEDPPAGGASNFALACNLPPLLDKLGVSLRAPV